MGLNIKNPDAERLIAELAELTGESKTQAVLQAVQERLERLQAQQKRASAEELMEMGREFVRDLEEPMTSTDHADILYDEDGLPK